MRNPRGCSGGTQAHLLRVELVQPVLHVAQGAQQVQPRLAQVQPGVECVNVLLAFVDARLLLGRGRELGRRARCAGSAVAHFELGYYKERTSTVCRGYTGRF